MGVTPEQSVNRQTLWLELQRFARERFESEIEADPTTFGIAPTASQRREERRRRSDYRRPGRGKNRQRKEE